MAAAQHTPGPWVAWDDGIFAGDDCIGVCNTETQGEAVDYANAVLMAAAPGILELLKQALAFIEADSPPCGTGECIGEVSAVDLKTGQRCEVDLFAVRAAIAKAEGR